MVPPATESTVQPVSHHRIIKNGESGTKSQTYKQVDILGDGNAGSAEKGKELANVELGAGKEECVKKKVQAPATTKHVRNWPFNSM